MSVMIRIIVVGIMLALPAWAQRGAGWNMQRCAGQGVCQSLIASIPRQALDADEIAGLTYMSEEEKLARDVYMKLSSKWEIPLFGNISQSEQRHFDVIKLLLDRYELADSTANKSAGVFQDPSLQTLYTDLVEQGEASFTGALRAGAAIEDLSLYSVEKVLAKTGNNDLRIVYQNLQSSSRNHMQVFASRLEARGERYAAQYVDTALLSEILTKPYNTGMGYGGGRNGPRGWRRGNGICPWGRTPSAK